MITLKEITAVTTPYPDGQRLTKAVLEYTAPMDGAQVTADAYAVAGRHILSAAVQGNTVTLELDGEDANAPMLIPPEHPRGPRPPQPHRGTPMNLPKPKFRPTAVTVSQLRDIGQAAAFSDVPSRKERHIGIEDFSTGDYQGQMYNLYTPENRGEKLPLVVFIPDAGVNGPEVRTPLIQGNGAMCFAAPEAQEKHPCYVLAFQYSGDTPLTADEFTVREGDFDRIYRAIQEICRQYPIDTSRIYLTGQSQGCMASSELLVRYPEVFASALLVAGQWNPETMGEKLRNHSMWIVVSESDFKAYPGMTAVADAIDAKGGKIGRYRWDAHIPAEAQAANVAAAVADGSVNRFTVLLDNDPAKAPLGHMGTWPVVYAIPGLRDWLFSQKGQRNDD